MIQMGGRVFTAHFYLNVKVKLLRRFKRVASVYSSFSISTKGEAATKSQVSWWMLKARLMVNDAS